MEIRVSNNLTVLCKVLRQLFHNVQIVAIYLNTCNAGDMIFLQLSDDHSATVSRFIMQRVRQCIQLFHAFVGNSQI